MVGSLSNMPRFSNGVPIRTRMSGLPPRVEGLGSPPLPNRRRGLGRREVAKNKKDPPRGGAKFTSVYRGMCWVLLTEPFTLKNFGGLSCMWKQFKASIRETTPAFLVRGSSDYYCHISLFLQEWTLERSALVRFLRQAHGHTHG